MAFESDPEASGLSTKTVVLDELMSKIGVGRFQVHLLLACGLGFAAGAVEKVLTGFLMLELKLVWKDSTYMLSSLPVLAEAGSMVGTLVWGRMADLYGRRSAFTITSLLVVVFSVASACSANLTMLAILRFGVGFGYGGNIAVDFALFSEMLPTLCRGHMLFGMMFFWPAAQVWTCGIAWVVIPSHGWRSFLLVCAIPYAIAVFLRLLIPESPRWLLVQGRREEAEEVCRGIATLNGLDSEQLGLSKGVRLVLSDEDQGLLSQRPPPSHFLQRLFGRSLWRTSLSCVLADALLAWGFTVTMTFMPTFLETKGIEATGRYAAMLLSAVAQFPGIVLATACAVYIGRCKPLQASLLLVGLAMAWFAEVKQQNLVLFCSCLASATIEFGYAIKNVYMAEVFPTELRATGLAVTSAAGTAMSLLTPMLMAFLLDVGSSELVAIVCAAAMLLGAVSLFFLLERETMDADLQDRVAGSEGGS